jgi:hypothetical protein
VPIWNSQCFISRQERELLTRDATLSLFLEVALVVVCVPVTRHNYTTPSLPSTNTSRMFSSQRSLHSSFNISNLDTYQKELMSRPCSHIARLQSPTYNIPAAQISCSYFIRIKIRLFLQLTPLKTEFWDKSTYYNILELLNIEANNPTMGEEKIFTQNWKIQKRFQ